MEKNVIDINDTLEVIQFLDLKLTRLQRAKNNDGVITSDEYGQALLSDGKEALAAWDGITDILREMKDRTDAENDLLVKTTLPLLFKLVKLWVPHGWNLSSDKAAVSAPIEPPTLNIESTNVEEPKKRTKKK